MALEAWTPDFQLSQRTVGKSFIRLRLPKLPLEYWSNEAMSRVVSILGKVTTMDESLAAEVAKACYARVCVQIEGNQYYCLGL